MIKKITKIKLNGENLISLDNLRKLVGNNKHLYTVHAQEQMAVRKVYDKEIKEIILGAKAEIIEEYPEDKYSPSCLIYGKTLQGRILHVQANYQALIITVYEPNSKKWQEDFKRRKK